MQIWTSKYGGFVFCDILNIEIYCADILHEVNGNFKETFLICHREMKITCTKVYSNFYFVIIVNKNIISLRVEQPVFW